MAYEGLEYTITNNTDDNGKIVVLVDRDNYDDIDENEDVYTYDWRTDDAFLGDHIRNMAQRAIENPIYLNGPATGEVYVIQGWGTMEELQKLADGEFVIELEPESIEIDDTKPTDAPVHEHKNYFEMHPICKTVAINWEVRTSEVVGSRDGFDYRIFDNPDKGRIYHADAIGSSPEGAVNFILKRNGSTILAGDKANYASAQSWINEYIDTVLFNEQNPGADFF